MPVEGFDWSTNQDTGVEGLSVLEITQATRALLEDLFVGRALVAFVERGEKHIHLDGDSKLVGRAGDVIVFFAGARISFENRPLVDETYKALALCYDEILVSEIFPVSSRKADTPAALRIASEEFKSCPMLPRLRECLRDETVHPELKRHRLLEPLVWLKGQGVDFPVLTGDQRYLKLRELLDADLSHDWRAAEVASKLAMSEASMRRWLASSGLAFSRVLMQARLERGMTLLQTTLLPISDVARRCGFKTHSHFGDSFRKKFGISPRQIRARNGMIEIR